MPRATPRRSVASFAACEPVTRGRSADNRTALLKIYHRDNAAEWIYALLLRLADASPASLAVSVTSGEVRDRSWIHPRDGAGAEGAGVSNLLLPFSAVPVLEQKGQPASTY